MVMVSSPAIPVEETTVARVATEVDVVAVVAAVVVDMEETVERAVDTEVVVEAEEDMEGTVTEMEVVMVVSLLLNRLVFVPHFYNENCVKFANFRRLLTRMFFSFAAGSRYQILVIFINFIAHKFCYTFQSII